MYDPPPSTTTDPWEQAPALGGARALQVRVDTFAGDGVEGHLDGPAAEARFRFPRGLAVDAAGILYVADWENHRIRRVTPDGTVSTLAGDGVAGFVDGPGATARFNFPRDVAVDAAGHVYVADTDNNRIRKITPAGMVTTFSGEGTRGFADGPRGTARFHYPNGVAVDALGVVYVADAGNTRVRRVSPGGTVGTLAGDEIGGYADAIGTEARFHSPRAIAVGPGGWVYVADYGNSRIRAIAPQGMVITFAGDGRGRHADGRGEPDFVNGAGPDARFCMPRGIAVGPTGVVYVADTSNHCIRRITLA